MQFANYECDGFFDELLDESGQPRATARTLMNSIAALPPGELLSRQGVYTGGYSNGNGDGKAAASILGRKNQIAELYAGMSKLQQEVVEISRRKGGSGNLSVRFGLQLSNQNSSVIRRNQLPPMVRPILAAPIPARGYQGSPEL